MGRISALVLKVMEYAKSFQDMTKLKQPAVITAGFVIGIAILINEVNALHPSIFAESSNSFGILKKLGLNKRIVNGMDIVAVDKIGAKYVFNKLILEKVKNKGVNTKDAGNICVIKNISTKNFIPFTRYLASPYPAGMERHIDNNMEPHAMIIEFFKGPIKLDI